MALDRDLPQAGVQESAAVKTIFVGEDGSRWHVEKEHIVLRKFNGEPEDGDLAEVLVMEDGVVVDHWVKGEARDAPG